MIERERNENLLNHLPSVVGEIVPCIATDGWNPDGWMDGMDGWMDDLRWMILLWNKIKLDSLDMWLPGKRFLHGTKIGSRPASGCDGNGGSNEISPSRPLSVSSVCPPGYLLSIPPSRRDIMRQYDTHDANSIGSQSTSISWLTDSKQWMNETPTNPIQSNPIQSKQNKTNIIHNNNGSIHSRTK